MVVRDVAVGALIATVIITMAALGALVSYVSRDSETFRKWLEGI